MIAEGLKLSKSTALIINYIDKNANEQELHLFLDSIQKRERVLKVNVTGADSFLKSVKAFSNHPGYGRYVDNLTEPIQQYILKGQMLNAVKEFKDRSGLGLKEAKDVIDAYKPYAQRM